MQNSRLPLQFHFSNPKCFRADFLLTGGGPRKAGTFQNPQPLVFFSQKYCRHKWEAYCGTTRRHIAVQNWRCIAAFPSLQGLGASEAQRYCKGGGGLLQYKLEAHCQYFSGKLYGLGSAQENSYQNSRQISRHPRQSKTENNFALRFCRVVVLTESGRRR